MYGWLGFSLLGLLWQTNQAVDPSYMHLPNNVIRVTSIELEPYLMRNPDPMIGSERDRYIGFIPDLLASLAERTGFDYVIIPVGDEEFGYRQSDGSWNGMIGELLRQEADVAAAPMYVTEQRARVIDFTESYLTVHATALLQKPPPETQLTVKSIGDLINQSEIQFGTLNHGVLLRSFKETNDTALKIMWRKIERFSPPTLTTSNEDGINRVRREKYAFIIPHTIGEYIANQPPCDLITLGRFLMSRGYSFAVQKGSPLRAQLNVALDALRESGRLNDLYRKWWFDRSPCDTAKTSKIYGSAYVTDSASSGTHRVSRLVTWATVAMVIHYVISSTPL